MGRHSGIETSDETPNRRTRRSRSFKQSAVAVLAFSASVSFLLVNVVDPFSGATASSEFRGEGDRFAGATPQAVEIEGDFSVAIAGEDYVVAEAEPEPVALAPAAEAWAPPAITPDPGSAQAYAQGAVAARGWPAGEFDCLVALWNKESGWRVNAYNPSGAYGIPQALPGSKMASAGADWETNAATQIEWGLGYIQGRYGTPCGAWSHSESAGWY